MSFPLFFFAWKVSFFYVWLHRCRFSSILRTTAVAIPCLLPYRDIPGYPYRHAIKVHYHIVLLLFPIVTLISAWCLNRRCCFTLHLFLLYRFFLPSILSYQSFLFSPSYLITEILRSCPPPAPLPPSTLYPLRNRCGMSKTARNMHIAAPSQGRGTAAGEHWPDPSAPPAPSCALCFYHYPWTYVKDVNLGK